MYGVIQLSWHNVSILLEVYLGYREVEYSVAVTIYQPKHYIAALGY